ncbi:MAG: fused isobutyryl-CoA mutase/GTPase IcmF [Kineosporiaceae bacterium]
MAASPPPDLHRSDVHPPDPHRPAHPVRFVTAAALFDGHDAAITIMRRLLQAHGAEVIHLGHDRSVADVVAAAVQEDVQGVAVSSYQGGHVEYFTYLVESLAAAGAGHVRVYGGGGGVIVADEIALLAERGVRVFSPEDGQRLGLDGMIDVLVRECDIDLAAASPDPAAVLAGDTPALARALTVLESGRDPDLARELRGAAARRTAPVLGITGTGGSGKSSLTDELVRRLRRDSQDKLRIAVLAVDPTRRRGGGALLGDRIRMTSLEPDVVYFRSLATRRAGLPLPEHLDDVVAACRAAGFDLVVVETPGTGQGDTSILDVADVSLYVMTPEFGAATQLEKIDMLDFADVVAINKFERRGAEDALRSVGRQVARNRGHHGGWEDMPVFGTSAARFDDDGITALYQHLRDLLAERGMTRFSGVLPPVTTRRSTGLTAVLPTDRERYLSEIAETVRTYHRATGDQVAAVRRRDALATAAAELAAAARVGAGDPARADAAGIPSDTAAAAGAVGALLREAEAALVPVPRELLAGWPAARAGYEGEDANHTTLSGSVVPRVALPRDDEAGALVRFLRAENLPGRFPFTAGVFPFKRRDEAATRMFAGEGDPARTNRRFHLLSAGQPATRLSTAFDSVTLYGRDPSTRPDVLGKVGTSGVSIATLDDMRDLFAGFDLCAPTTSVSMTINGPAPAILAMFLTVAIEQQIAAFEAEHGRPPDAAEAADVRARTLRTVRGTVQADILKEDQGQNTCIFSTDFALRCMADVQEWFIDQGVRYFYSVSISGYHIAEAGANPITQLAFTLANAFTYVEAYRARGMAVDDFAPNLSFFFSNGMDAEYTVLGRVARRIWAIALRDRYGAGERSQKLKYHIQTSGRSLHAQEMAFNDIRTTLQALCAVYDHANSLHTNAYDEAVTTPSPESVRRALAIQLVIDQEWGLADTENPLQGSFVVDRLTDLVEEAVLAEFDRLTARGGVLGAMETGYQRGRIQDESMLYERRKHDGSLPIVGVNTFLPEGGEDAAGPPAIPLSRATEAEKQSQLDRLAGFHRRHAGTAPAALERLRHAATTGGNVFDALMAAVPHCSLGQITDAFHEVGGRYRRTM